MERTLPLLGSVWARMGLVGRGNASVQWATEGLASCAMTPQHPQQCPTPQFFALSAEEQALVRELHRDRLKTWHNAKNDTLGLYNHMSMAAHTTHPEQSVFVTSDGHFHTVTKLAKLRALGFRGEILPPDAAVDFLRADTGGTPSEIVG